MQKETPEERFKAKWKRAPSGCWEWQACLNSKGYGCFSFGGKGKNVLAHRWAWEQAHGPIPAEMTIDHRCRNRRCVRPSHLRVVSLVVNSTDREHVWKPGVEAAARWREARKAATP